MVSSSGTGRSLWRASKGEQQHLKTKNSSKHFHLSETSETSSYMGKRTGCLYLGQAEQPPPEGDACSTGTRARRGCGDTAGGGRAAGGTAGPRDRALGTAGPRGTRGCCQHRAAGQGAQQHSPALQPARHSPSPEPPSHTHLRNCTLSLPCPRCHWGFEHTELQETLPCSLPGPQTSREWGKHTGKTHPHSVSSLHWLCLKTLRFLHLQ